MSQQIKADKKSTATDIQPKYCHEQFQYLNPSKTPPHFEMHIQTINHLYSSASYTNNNASFINVYSVC